MTSETLNEAVQTLGGTHGSTLRAAKERISQLSLDTSHFKSRGFRRDFDPVKISPEEILIENSPFAAKAARNAFKRFRCISYKCSECPTAEIWNNKPIVLTLDHIDGDSRNHSPKNLRWLCPNCHSQTPTFCGRNRKNPKRRIGRKSSPLNRAGIIPQGKDG